MCSVLPHELGGLSRDGVARSKVESLLGRVPVEYLDHAAFAGLCERIGNIVLDDEVRDDAVKLDRFASFHVQVLFEDLDALVF